MTLAIEAVGLVKRFEKTLAVDGVDLADLTRVTELALRLASLDEIFMALTGHAAEEGGR